MKNITLYFNSFPAKDKGFKGKEYNNYFLTNLRKRYKKNIKIYTIRNSRKNDLNFKKFLFEFNPKDIFDNINSECRKNINNFPIIENLNNDIDNYFCFKIATNICKSKNLRLRLASELDRYSNKLSTSSTYDLIFRLASVYANEIKIKNINYAIFYETPHSFWDTILCEVMKLINCEVIILTRTLFDNLLLDREKSILNEFKCSYCKKERNNITNYINNINSLEKNIEIKSFWNSFNQKNILKAQNSNIKKSRKIIKNLDIYYISKSIYNFINKLISDIKNYEDWRDTSEIFYYKNSVWDKLRANMKRLIYSLSIFRRKDLYNKFVSKSDQTYLIENLNKKFVYYPLPVEPERTTIPEGGENWYHLLSTVSQIRSFIPKDYALVIKEHPNMFIHRQSLFGYRTPFFYNAIANLENTYLLNYNLDSSLILKAAKVVVINSGSSGFEAFLNGTSVIALGDPWYKDLKGINKASSQKELLNSLEICISRKDPTLNKIKQDLKKFICKKNFIYGSTSIGLTKILDYFSKMQLKRHSLKSASSLIDYINFIELTKH